MTDALPLVAAFASGYAGAELVRRAFALRPAPPSLADLVPWAFLAGDGVVVLKDGSLLGGFKLSGPDVTTTTASERARISAHLASTLAAYTDRWIFSFDVVRRPVEGYAPPGYFEQPVAELVDDLRRARYTETAHFETDLVLTVTCQPDRPAQRRLAKLLVSASSERGQDPWRESFEAFERAVSDLVARLSAQLRVEPLGSDALLTHLHTCLTCDFQPVAAPPADVPLDQYLADQI